MQKDCHKLNNKWDKFSPKKMGIMENSQKKLWHKIGLMSSNKEYCIQKLQKL